MILLDNEEWNWFMEELIAKSSTKEELDELEKDLDFYLDMVMLDRRK